MLKKVLFCHDHLLSEFEGKYYSAGKLDYSKFKFYLDIFKNLTLVSRGKPVSKLDLGVSIVNGPNLDVETLPNLASVNGLIHRGKIRERLAQSILLHDAVIVRLPSEIGLMALDIAQKTNKPVLVEVVANAYDCLKYRGDLLAKIYAPFLEWRMRKACLNADVITYVTSKYLQKKYPSNGMQAAISDAGINEVLPARKFPTSDTFTIGVIGNPDVKLKGIKIALDAVSQARKISGLNIILKVLGGEGKNFILDNGNLPSWCSFTNVLIGESKVNVWLDDLDIYVQPSFTEGLPRALVEAMSRGLPCFGSDVGGIPELLSKKYVFKPGNSGSLSSSLLMTIQDENNYQVQSISCLQKAKEYDKKSILIKRISFYKQFALNHAP
jgi:glycosyltransferase involved in cell wall biosynthesis